MCYIDIHSNSNYYKSLCLHMPCINCAGEKTLNKKCGRLKKKKVRERERNSFNSGHQLTLIRTGTHLKVHAIFTCQMNSLKTSVITVNVK